MITKMRIYAVVFSAVLFGLTLLPILQIGADKPVDGFPMSHYPMFSNPRPEFETPIYVVGFDHAGARHKIPYPYWTPGGFNQASMQLKAARAEGQESLDAVCEHIAAGIARKPTRALAGVGEVVIERGHYNMVKYFQEGDKTPHKKKALASCRVRRRP